MECCGSDRYILPRPILLTLTGTHKMTRCDKITARGPCRREAVEGSHYCSLHSKTEDMLTAYKLTNSQLNEDIRHHARASVTDLSAQVVLMKSMVQRRLNMAGDSDAEQITAINYASSALPQVIKATETLVKLARESGELMSRVEVEELIDSIINIVSDEFQEANLPETVVDKIASRIAEELSESPEEKS